MIPVVELSLARGFTPPTFRFHMILPHRNNGQSAGDRAIYRLFWVVFYSLLLSLMGTRGSFTRGGSVQRRSGLPLPPCGGRPTFEDGH